MPSPTPVRTAEVTSVDVAVVGAGLAGLVTARALAAQGRRVVVLEAADVVGGRTRSAQIGGATVDLGGTFVGPTQDRVLQLARELGCATFPTYSAGHNLVSWRGSLRRYKGTIPKISPVTLADVERVRILLDRAAGRLTVAADDPRDLMSLETWLRRIHAGRGTRDLMAIVCKTSWGCEPAEISLLHVLRYLKGCGGVARMLDTENGAQQDHFVAGAQEMSRRMARDLGSAVHLGSPVTSITTTPDDTVVVSCSDRSFAAEAVVVAVPPAMRGRITFDPPLPPPYAGLAQRWPQGVLSKAYAVYATPFWREQGLSGQALADEGPVFVTFDASPHDARVGVLLGFVGGDYARRFDQLPPAERRLQVLQSFAALFGEQALTPIDVVDQRWSTEPWIGGGPTAVPAPGAVNGYGRFLARPVGRVFWAGTETSDTWTGFMDGAVRSGERAALDVLAALAAHPDREAAR